MVLLILDDLPEEDPEVKVWDLFPLTTVTEIPGITGGFQGVTVTTVVGGGGEDGTGGGGGGEDGTGGDGGGVSGTRIGLLWLGLCIGLCGGEGSGLAGLSGRGSLFLGGDTHLDILRGDKPPA